MLELKVTEKIAGSRLVYLDCSPLPPMYLSDASDFGGDTRKAYVVADRAMRMMKYGMDDRMARKAAVAAEKTPSSNFIALSVQRGKDEDVNQMSLFSFVVGSLIAGHIASKGGA